MIGTRIGPYEITAKLGEGGMGEVYRATDSKLKREVAIKVLPAAFTADRDRLARFEREAQLLAQLQHPNIASIYGLEESDGTRALVMELVEGQDLAARIARGPMALDEVLAIGRQLAEALEAAHERGIVHRDLKPANVMVTAAGQVKILDFGLAKAMAAGGDPGSSPLLSQSPTITRQMTQAGTLMGTAAYMSPEQARGREADKRADIWAFGVVLFELLSGETTFGGDTVSDTLAAVLRENPDFDELPAIPADLRRMLERCLDKDPRQRLRDIGEARIRIERLQAGDPAPTIEADAPAQRSSKRLRGAWIAAIVLASLGITGIVLASLAAVASLMEARSGTAREPARVVGMSQLTDLPGSQTEPALSPDGKQLLYVSMDGGDRDIFLQRVGGEKPVNLTVDFDGDDAQPAFSPDGERIVFRSDRQGGGIFVMGATGESPHRVSDRGYDPAWSPDGTKIVYAGEYNDDPYNRGGYVALRIVDLDTGADTELNEIDGMSPDWSPGGQRIAFWTHFYKVQGQRDIVTIAAAGGEPVMVTDDVYTDWDPVWSPDGRWLYFASDRGGSPDLWRVAIDETTGVTRGEPQPVTTGPARIMQLDIAADGRIALTASRQPGEIRRYDFDPVAERVMGKPDVLAASSNVFSWFTIGFDGRTMAYGTSAPLEQLYWMDIDRGDRRRLLSDEHRNRGPALSPDGRWVAFFSNRGGSYDLWALRSDGTGLRQLTESALDVSIPVWLPDGSLVASATDADTYELVRLTPGDGGLDAVQAPLPLEPVENGERLWPSQPSPDGRRLTVGIYDGHGGTAPAVYELGSARVVRPDPPDGRPFAFDWNGGSWLDDKRYAFWDPERRRHFVADADTGKARPLEGVEGPAGVRFAHQGRVMIVNRSRVESDVWLLTLAK